jgi:hypothetical protein
MPETKQPIRARGPDVLARINAEIDAVACATAAARP